MPLDHPAGTEVAEASVQEIPGYNGSLLILNGSYSLNVLEKEFTSLQPTINARNEVSWHARTNRYVGAFRAMLNALINDLKIDFVLVDCAPADSAINKFMTMTSDFILPPVFPDFFSMSSIEGLLSNVLPDWYNWRAQVSSKEKEVALVCDCTPYMSLE